MPFNDVAKQLIIHMEVGFFYDSEYDEKGSKEYMQAIADLYDSKIKAAHHFLEYLNLLDKDGGSEVEIRTSEYRQVQEQLTDPTIDGGLFAKLNRDYNRSTFDVDSTREGISRRATESSQAIKHVIVSKQKYNDALAKLSDKPRKIDFTNIGKMSPIKDQALLFHFNKVCQWILDIFYDTPASKFEWDNFKNNVFITDKGEDFSKRIIGLYIPKLYDYQIETAKYINDCRPMFLKYTNNQDLDLLLSTSLDIIEAYNARVEYTNYKKTLEINKGREMSETIEIANSDKISKATKPYVVPIYDLMIQKEQAFRTINMSDFVKGNKANYYFLKGSGGKIKTFTRNGAPVGGRTEIQATEGANNGKPHDSKKPKLEPIDNAAVQAPVQDNLHPISQTQIPEPVHVMSKPATISQIAPNIVQNEPTRVI